MSWRRIFSYFLIFFFLLIFLRSKNYLEKAEQWISPGLIPVTKTFYGLGKNLAKGWQKWFSRKNLYAENQFLNEQVTKLIAAEAELKTLKEENDQLRQTLNFAKRERRLIMAEVVGKNSDGLAAALIIDRGSRDGLAPGYPVIVSDGLLIGQIYQVTETKSFLRLLTDNQSKIAAAVLSGERTIGVVSGRQGKSLFLEMIPQNELIKKGETVITSGLDDLMPRGLLIGKIDSVSKYPYEPFQRASLVPLVQAEKINAVTVLLPYQ